MPELAPNPQLLASLGRLVRGLSALFWGLPIALVVCVQTATAKDEWLRSLGVLPPIAATGLLFYGLALLGSFQKQERIWRSALDRAKVFALVNLGLAPFLYWWNKIPANDFFGLIIQLMVLAALYFLVTLNGVLERLTAMLPDETLRMEAKLFTKLNRMLLYLTLALSLVHFLLLRAHHLPLLLAQLVLFLNRSGLWLPLFLVLLPVAMTMALIWKIKEVILASVFGPE